jgi:hypothetical protein
MKLPEPLKTHDESYYLGIEQRLTRSSICLGVATTTILLLWGGVNLAGSFVLGALLSYVNFCWLKEGVDHLLITEFMAVPARRSTRKIIVKYFLRYALIGAVLYAIVRVKFLDVRIAFLGLLLFVAAILFECIYQVIKGLSDGRA